MASNMSHQKAAEFLALIIRVHSDDRPDERDIINLAIAIDSGFHVSNVAAIDWAIRAYRMSPSEFGALFQFSVRRVKRYRRRPNEGASNKNKGGGRAHIRLTPNGVNL